MELDKTNKKPERDMDRGQEKDKDMGHRPDKEQDMVHKREKGMVTDKEPGKESMPDMVQGMAKGSELATVPGLSMCIRLAADSKIVCYSRGNQRYSVCYSTEMRYTLAPFH